MYDLIDRNAVYDAIGFERCNRSCTDCPTKCTWFYIINNIPTVNRLIPCSDRLPEKSGDYLVYTEYEDVFKCYFEKENDPEEDECQWGLYQDYRDPDTLGWAGTTWNAVETVTHWMTLPEPTEKV